MPMSLIDFLSEELKRWLPALGAAAALIAGLWLSHWWLLKRHPHLGSERKLPRQLAILGITVLGIVAIIVVLPVDSSTRNQLLALLGFIASAIIGLASTTLVANAMASVMLRTTNSIRTGDFLRVGGHFGRVTERGLLHMEIQTENRDLTTLPNSYLISTPYTVVRSSGTIVSTTLSLGYDVPVEKVEPLLLDAAKQVGLEEPFVRVMELGNFAITYRISGFLAEIKHLLSVQSDLCKAVIATLHGADVEIVSPTFMNQRPLPDGLRFIPKPTVPATDAGTQPPPEVPPPPEELMFDKAEEAEQVERARETLESDLKELEHQAEQAEGDERKRIQKLVQERRKELADLAEGGPTDAAK
jgi:small-conductance mechanosensitive channel